MAKNSLEGQQSFVLLNSWVFQYYILIWFETTKHVRSLPSQCLNILFKHVFEPIQEVLHLLKPVQQKKLNYFVLIVLLDILAL